MKGTPTNANLHSERDDADGAAKMTEVQNQIQYLHVAMDDLARQRDDAQSLLDTQRRATDRLKWGEVIRSGEECIQEEQSLLLFIGNVRDLLGIAGRS